MTTCLHAWAARHSIPAAALADLRATLGALDYAPPPAVPGDSEAAVQSRIRLEASAKGLRIWRNNVGAVHTTDGQHIRYGLANDSPQVNDRIKSSDLIGIRPVTIRSWDIGRTVGQFVAREVKHARWEYTGTAREVAQLRYLELVATYGGDACFARTDDTL